MPSTTTTAADPGRILEQWRRERPHLDERAAETVLRALLQAGASHEVGRTLLEFDPELQVTLEELRGLRASLHGEVERAGLDTAEAARLFESFQDVFERVAAREVRRLEELALVDPLTGLGNRRAASDDLRSALAHAERHGRTVTIAVIDLDGLKLVNDAGGHAAGDMALRRLGDAIRSTARVDDSAYRMGGDEFMVIAPDSLPQDVERLVTRLSAVGPAFSAGIASAPTDATEPDHLIAVADRRLYERKPGPPARPSGPAPSRAGLLGVFLLAALSAELARRLLQVDLVRERRLLWAALVVGAPLLAAHGDRLPPFSWRRRADARFVLQRAALLALALLAALVPLVGFG